MSLTPVAYVVVILIIGVVAAAGFILGRYWYWRNRSALSQIDGEQRDVDRDANPLRPIIALAVIAVGLIGLLLITKVFDTRSKPRDLSGVFPTKISLAPGGTATIANASETYLNINVVRITSGEKGFGATLKIWAPGLIPKEYDYLSAGATAEYSGVLPFAIQVENVDEHICRFVVMVNN